jgi:single-strand DNA-binding protein
MNYNKAIIAGHLTADPELRYTPSGKACANFTVAATRRYTDPNGEKKEQTLFMDCAAWGAHGEHIKKHKTKGDNLLVEGFLQADQWEDKSTGQKRSKIKLVVEKVEFGKKAVHTDHRDTEPPRPRTTAAGEPVISDDYGDTSFLD